MRYTKLIILLFLLLLSYAKTEANHIVGGELYYTCFGNNEYEITLELYRDCAAQGSNVAPYGRPEYVAVFDQNNTVDTIISLEFPGSDTLENHYDNNCIDPPPGVCVEEAIYTDTVNLPPTPGGHTLVYQRCCRNSTISNVQNPGSVGSTYSAHIPEPPLDCNNSPRFNNFPPIFICEGQPLEFDHSATDLDGDSLVYEVCDPFEGASQNCPNPSPANTIPGCPNQPSSPPYTSIPWASGFSASNPLGGNTFSIDQQSGQLTTTPPTQGQYVVGVCVKEYRNGQLVGRTKRDFQFNVVDCQAPFANVPTTGTDPSTGLGIYSIDCNDYTVSFLNNSTNATSYFWDFGDPTTQADQSTAAQPSYSYPDTGSYVVTLVAENQQGCRDSTQAVVKIYPFFQADFSKTGFCTQEPISFTDKTISTHGNVDSWSWDFGDGATSNQPNPTHAYSSSGTYDVHLTTTSDKGCNHDTVKTIDVYAKPNADFNHSNTCVGDSTYFTNKSSVNGSSIISSSWSFGDGTISLQKDPTHYYSSSGNYPVNLIVETLQGCQDTFSKSVDVYDLPTVQVNQDTIVCEGTPADLWVTGGTNYDWSPGEVLNDSTIAQPKAIVDTSTTFSVTVTDTNQCTRNTSTTVNTKPAPTVTGSPDTSICLGNNNTAQINATGTPTYNWSPSTGLSCVNCQSPTASPSDTTLYTVTGTAPNGCTDTDSVLVDVLDPSINPIVPDTVSVCSNDSVTISAFGGDNYQWSPSSGLSSPNVQSPTFTPATSQTYNVTISNYCFSKSDSVEVIVFSAPAADAGKDQNICRGDTTEINGTGGNDQFWKPDQWIIDSTQATTKVFPDSTQAYVLTTTTPKGCSSEDSITINVVPPPEAQAFGDTTICRGGSAPLEATGGNSYKWEPTSGLSCVNCPQPLATPVDSTSFRVEVTQIPGCERYDTVLVNVLQPVTASALGQNQICPDDTVKLSGDGGFSYEWQPSPEMSPDTSQTITVSPDTSVTYTLIGRNGCPGFADTTTFSINVRDLPPLDAGEDQKIFRGRSASLEATGGMNFRWEPVDNLATPQSATTEASPFSSTTYTVSAENRFGCKATDSVTVTVEAKTILAVPTAFSPDDNGTNDTFHIIDHLNIKELTKYEVYNRWGEKVFQGENINDSWDGTHAGEEQAMDTYIYVIEAINLDGETITRSGNVTLIR